MKIALIGGHGKVALLATPELVNRGHQVTSFYRNPDHTGDVNATGATAVVLDIESATQEDLAEAFAGHDAVVWSAGAGGGSADRTYAVDRDAAVRSMRAAEQAGVKRYIMVSFATADEKYLVNQDDSFYPYMAAKIAADAHLRGTGLDWTVLGPGRLTLEESTGAIEVLDEPGENTDTSRGNVALSIVEALENEGSIGRTINFRDGSTSIHDVMAGTA
ncbi:SDR family oxidoreductase [Zhihengliuella halotolerans]|uniref:Putative NADH-flavin reductase n=1 Tax=Zhihengliuella halotolerans TaxID=370736 RepID=A0A4Q8AGQ0_9MICC|nr:SDR family oxidoreductase [Zhihengliuella halotolerans]RZU62903.1 putative NADH-flavin reductase [Zhihengliuella halotolerans]